MSPTTMPTSFLLVVLCCFLLAMASAAPETRSSSLHRLKALEPLNAKIQMWTEAEIAEYMFNHSQRAYFPELFAQGGFRSGMEVGVAAGRFSELFLLKGKEIPGTWKWTMVEPFPNSEFIHRYAPAAESPQVNGLNWEFRDIGRNANKTLIKALSLDTSCLAALKGQMFDFVYLDGAHDYENVKKEIGIYWNFVNPGGILAGHDYCNYGETPLPCKGCQLVPACVKYTEFAAKKRRRRAANQIGVVKAVQEWHQEQQPSLTLYHTTENFSRTSLAADKIDYDLIITSTRNPSWFFYKPLQ